VPNLGDVKWPQLHAIERPGYMAVEVILDKITKFEVFTIFSFHP
jgi:hypothetical protein